MSQPVTAKPIRDEESRVIPRRVDAEGPRNCNFGLLAHYTANPMSDQLSRESVRKSN
jgi:hypothetical protein